MGGRPGSSFLFRKTPPSPHALQHAAKTHEISFTVDFTRSVCTIPNNISIFIFPTIILQAFKGLTYIHK